MKKLHLPYVKLPGEFVTLLKTNLSVTTSPAPIFDVIRPNRALYRVLETSFKEFDDGRGVEKVLLALGWSSFRDRMGSLFIYKTIYGNYPATTRMDLVEDILGFEARFSDHGVHSFSRLFLLGFYLKMASIQMQARQENQFLELKIPEEVYSMLKLSQGRTERIDWLILIITHLVLGLGNKVLASKLVEGKKLDEIYPLLSDESRAIMFENLLAYGASINEPDFFLYERV